MEYIYLGDKLTDPALQNQPCNAIRNRNGKCIRGKNGNMFVQFADGRRAVVFARRLRRTDKRADKQE